ncbi:hypothetical protein GCM10025868_15800 [Angustibacter aerolatus]|uniref:SAF domain-containing protein n=1 Tax=Angustibacter aerolatus TaxID=1162965 RepID=A0ABQ6JGJ5_9ACTN|nr:hypothetical protein GCM10025868_15800 [Angustibacter aerolatus]
MTAAERAGGVAGWLARVRPARDPGWAPLRRRRPGRRRLLAAALLAVTAAAVVRAAAPVQDPGVPVLVAAHDLPAGAALAEGDVQTVHRPADGLPSGALRRAAEAVGRPVTGPVRAGEVLTDVRLLGPGLVQPALLSADGGAQVAAPVRVADAQAAGLVRAGDRVDVLLATETARAARAVVRGATVLARPEVPDAGGPLAVAGDPSGGALLVLAVTDPEAADLALAATRGPLSLVLH